MVKEPIVKGKYLSEFRKSIGLTQKQFAERLDIGVSQIKLWETDRRNLKFSTFHEIKEKLGYLEADSSLVEVLVDYVRFTIKEIRDLDYFVSKYLYLDFKDFVSEETGLYGYSNRWCKGDIWILDYFDKGKKNDYLTTIQLSGKGCRQLELSFVEHNVTWEQFFSDIYTNYSDFKMNRLDIAFDEKFRGFGNEDKQIDLALVRDNKRKHQVFLDTIKKWSCIEGGESVFKESSNEWFDKDDGLSLYFGSRQSAFYMNFYEKRYELAKKENMSVREAVEIFGVWNRFELRFQDYKSMAFLEEVSQGREIADTARAVLNKEIVVYNGVGEYGEYIPYRPWQEVLGGYEILKLTMKPEVYDVEKTFRWLIDQVSNSLVLFDEIGKKVSINYLTRILEAGELTDKYQKILDQISVEDRERLFKGTSKNPSFSSNLITQTLINQHLDFQKFSF